MKFSVLPNLYSWVHTFFTNNIRTIHGHSWWLFTKTVFSRNLTSWSHSCSDLYFSLMFTNLHANSQRRIESSHFFCSWEYYMGKLTRRLWYKKIHRIKKIVHTVHSHSVILPIFMNLFIVIESMSFVFVFKKFMVPSFIFMENSWVSY